MKELTAQRELYQGFGDTFTRSIEMVLTPLLFAVGGWALDRSLGTSPVLLIALALFGLAGTGVRAYYGYVRRMNEHEENAPWRRS